MPSSLSATYEHLSPVLSCSSCRASAGWGWRQETCVLCCHFCGGRLSVTPWTTARQASLSLGFSRQAYWSGLPCPLPGDLPDPGIEPMSPMSPALQADSLPTEPSGKPTDICGQYHFQATKRLCQIQEPGEPYNLKGCVVSHKPKNTNSGRLLWHISCRPKKTTPAYFFVVSRMIETVVFISGSWMNCKVSRHPSPLV